MLYSEIKSQLAGSERRQAVQDVCLGQFFSKLADKNCKNGVIKKTALNYADCCFQSKASVRKSNGSN